MTRATAGVITTTRTASSGHPPLWGARWVPFLRARSGEIPSVVEIDLLDADRFQRGEHHDMFRRLRAEDPDPNCVHGRTLSDETGARPRWGACWPIIETCSKIRR